MGKFISQKNYYYKESLIERNISSPVANFIIKPPRFSIHNVPRKIFLGSLRPFKPWNPSQESLSRPEAESNRDSIAEKLNNVSNGDNSPQKNATLTFSRDFITAGIANNKPRNISSYADYDCLDEAADFDEMDKPAENEFYRPSGIRASEFQPVPDHRNTGYTDDLTEYLLNTLIPRVNLRGKAPWWLRPLAAFAAWFGYHGLGQTNCLSCAASVADTLKQRVLHQAFPRLRGSSPSMFSTLQRVLDAGGVKALDSTEDLATFLNSSRVNLNIVLTINRPASFWRRLFSSVDGHACNIIRTGECLHLVDAQKRRYNLVNMTSANRLSKDLITALQEFVGAVSPEERSLMLYHVGW